MIKISKLVDLTGQKFGRLKVLEFSHTDKNYNKYWKVRCDCENKTEFSIRGNSLTSGGFTKSCGCLLKEITSKRNTKKNTYDLTREYGIGYTSKGEEFYFDLEDYDKIKDYCWRENDNGYIVTDIDRSPIRMHRFILDYDGELQIDHWDRVRHNNQKENLRYATNQQNSFNKDTLGVYFDKSRNKWVARLVMDGKNMLHKRFETFNDALIARLNAEQEYFCDFAPIR